MKLHEILRERLLDGDPDREFDLGFELKVISRGLITVAVLGGLLGLFTSPPPSLFVEASSAVVGPVLLDVLLIARTGRGLALLGGLLLGGAIFAGAYQLIADYDAVTWAAPGATIVALIAGLVCCAYLTHRAAAATV